MDELPQSSNSLPPVCISRAAPASRDEAPAEPLLSIAQQWDQSWGRQLLPVAAFLVAGCLALAVDMPLARFSVLQKGWRWIHPVLDRLESFGDAIVASLLIAGVAICHARNRRMAPRLLAIAMGAGLLADVIKLFIIRNRPNDFPLVQGTVWDTFGGWFPFFSVGAARQSCPSAHTALATGLCLGLSALYPRGKNLFLALTVAVAWQRIDVGAHYLSDTCFGAAVGYLVTLLVCRPGPLGNWFTRWEGRGGSCSTGLEQAATSSGQESFSGAAGLSAENIRPRLRIASMHGGVSDAPEIRKVSAVIPVYNEDQNIVRMFQWLVPVLESLQLPWEIVFVDDGSRDGTDQELQSLARQCEFVKVVTFRRNYGQTAAMSAGMRHATGDAIVLLDGDLQNDPHDIPQMLAKLGEGFDLVHGWRKNRQDRFLDRKLPSLIANWLISRVTQFPVHDLGCTLKVIRGDIARELHLYGEMHRFIPILAHQRGARCVEMVTRHHARQFGTSKYGISRTFRVLLDLLTVQFITRHLASPVKYFGKVALVCLGLGACAGAATLAMKLGQGVDMTGNPLLLAAVFGALLGVQFLSVGLLGELVARIYFAHQDHANYTIRRTTNLQANVDEADPRPQAVSA